MIEGILNRDKKTATYKLALFRALAEIATTEFEQAQWVADAVVGIPIQLVCEKWLYYYWPLFESTTFIPQIRGESPSSAKPIAFRLLLCELIDQYRGAGGLTRFVLDLRSRTLPKAASATLEQTLKQIRKPIVEGPVTFAGGSLETGRIFEYDSRSQNILFSAGIWRELSLVGHWIQDATILRWAELTSEIARQAIRPSAAIDLLLTVPIPERDAADAKAIYRRLGTRSCTWTGVALPNEFAVDHIIPFSLWHNNDLWNLVPASAKVNAAKSDKLPARELMLRRRQCLTAIGRSYARRTQPGSTMKLHALPSRNG